MRIKLHFYFLFGKRNLAIFMNLNHKHRQNLRNLLLLIIDILLIYMI